MPDRDVPVPGITPGFPAAGPGHAAVNQIITHLPPNLFEPLDTIHLAPAGYHLLIERDRCFAYSVDEPVHYSRPSIDVLFESAADAYGAGLAGVMLTGASPDGAKGLMRIRQAGGLAIVQDPAEALASAMPQAALDQAGADHCLPLARIAPLLNELAHRE